ncbi:M23 family metallopeptidase [Bifidobacterium imperatoris]|uniref:M23 family metallopeptidase n=2 Tax=Bifidobacterium imperatoris TaxID=2020965 RepID=A0A2N5IPR2_9BIFI|nr:M23 family metallopeptidase [Bifidobacterium imperatoris]PLS23943.1 peptidase M23 [Bifidobacterium imperatoris]QSY57545.1 M23 family metallopeptidase [Bifidobacterium imperatoris]
MNGYWFDWRRQSAQRAMRQREQERQQAQEQQTKVDAAVAVASVLGLLLALLIGISFSNGSSGAWYSQDVDSSCAPLSSAEQSGLVLADFTDLSAWEQRTAPQCSAQFAWPVHDAIVTDSFDQPLTPWATGHRGLDLSTSPGEAILAPRVGTISFAGRVGGKDVVSIRHRGGVTSTFEPALTDLSVGTTVLAGDSIGVVRGDSDHCEDSCLHWGLKRGSNDYLDPELYAVERKIVLKQ